MTITWPDGGLGFIFALKGWKRGFVAELAGAAALAIAIVAAIRYPGSLDDIAERYTHASPGAAHIAGMVLFALAFYAAVMALTFIAGRFARLPVISIGNSAAGAAVGLCKAFAATWAVLYVALFFPLPHALRGDLRRSTMVSIVTEPNRRIDALMRGALPAFAAPLTDPIFTNHRV